MSHHNTETDGWLHLNEEGDSTSDEDAELSRVHELSYMDKANPEDPVCTNEANPEDPVYIDEEGNESPVCIDEVRDRRLNVSKKIKSKLLLHQSIRLSLPLYPMI